MLEGHSNTRNALSDVSNQIGKRGFSSILDDGGMKSSDGGYGGLTGNENAHVMGNDTGKRARTHTEINSLKGIPCDQKELNLSDSSLGRSVTQETSKSRDGNYGGLTERENVHVMGNDTVKRAWPCTEIDSLNGNFVAGISSIPCEQKELNLSDSTLGTSVTQRASKSRDDVDSVDVEVIGDSEEARLYSRGSQEEDTGFSLESDANALDNLVLSQTGSVDCTRLPESQESINFNLERCTGLKGNGRSSLTGDDSLITSCSCSFCKKAAYIWFDLHYQDMKGLISTLKKSQKDASVLADKTSKNKGKGIVGTDCSGKKSNLEHDLIAQWRSLFLQTEQMFANEGKQLETRLLPLQDLREKSKMALELVNPTPAKND